MEWSGHEVPVDKVVQWEGSLSDRDVYVVGLILWDDHCVHPSLTSFAFLCGSLGIAISDLKRMAQILKLHIASLFYSSI